MTPVVDGPPAVPRTAWAEHPRFPTQTLLLGSHANFRRISRVLLARAEAGRDSQAIRWVFRQWKAAMHSHEHYEERKLYPYLAHRWGLSFDAARAGHDALREAEEAVLEACAEPGPATPALAEALRVHDAVLDRHLELEEDLVIPALLGLAPEEFERYTRSDLATLLGR